MASENIVKNRYYRVLTDAENEVWDTVSFNNFAEDTNFDDGQNAEVKLGAVNGITSDLACEDDSIAASAAALNQVNQSLDAFNRWIKIDINHTFTSVDTTYKNIGTFEELIGCNEVIVELNNTQSRSVNLQKETLFTFSAIGQIANDMKFSAQCDVKIDFTTGTVTSRQSAKGSTATYRTFDAIYYR